MSKPRIYLAGPITGLSYDEATQWRKRVTKLLKNEIECFDPMRDKDFLRNIDKLQDINKSDNISTTADFILTRDYNDCVNADLLLINFEGSTERSAGTFMEVAWAYMKHIPVVIFCSDYEDNINCRHPMLKKCTSIFCRTEEEAIYCTRSFLLSQPKKG